MKTIIILTTIIILASCSKKCEYSDTTKYESGTYCFSDDGSYWQEYESYTENWEFDENYNIVVTGITTNKYSYSGTDESFFNTECENQTVVSGSCQ